MKKILLTMSLFLFVLAGCNETTEKETKLAKEDTKAETTAEKKSTDKETGPSEEELARYGAYYQIVNSLKNEYGILTEDDQLFTNNEGLAYIDLIDFDLDGQEELYMIYEKVSESYGNSGFYAEEIWGYKDDREVKLFSKEFSNGGLVDDASRFIVTADGRSYLMESGSYSTGSSMEEPDWNQNFIWSLFFELEDGEFKEKDRLDIIELSHVDTQEEKKRYEINKKEVTIDEADQFLEEYGYSDRKLLIDSDFGSKSLPPELVGNMPNQVNDMIQQLKEKMNPAVYEANIYSEKTVAEKEELIRFLNHFTGLEQLDGQNGSDEQLLDFIANGVFDGYIGREALVQNYDLDSIVSDVGFQYVPYPESQVNQLIGRLFGRTIETSEGKHYLSEGRDYELAIYQDGYFYLLSPERGSSIEGYSAQLDSLYSLKDGLYYTEFTRHTVDKVELSEFGMEEDFLNTPMEAWTPEQKSLNTDPTQTGYAIVKRTKGTWELIKYCANGSLPSEKELQQYINM